MDLEINNKNITCISLSLLFSDGVDRFWNRFLCILGALVLEHLIHPFLEYHSPFIPQSNQLPSTARQSLFTVLPSPAKTFQEAAHGSKVNQRSPMLRRPAQLKSLSLVAAAAAHKWRSCAARPLQKQTHAHHQPVGVASLLRVTCFSFKSVLLYAHVDTDL
jgi:hypothetical protein